MKKLRPPENKFRRLCFFV